MNILTQGKYQKCSYQNIRVGPLLKEIKFNLVLLGLKGISFIKLSQHEKPSALNSSFCAI